MAAADSSRTPAWGGPSSARSKYQRASTDYFHMLTLFSTRLGRSRWWWWWFSHPRLENGRLSHIEPIRRQPHSLRRIRWCWWWWWRRTHPSLERRRSHTIWRQLRHERFRRLRIRIPNSSLGRRRCKRKRKRRKPHTRLVRRRHGRQ